MRLTFLILFLISTFSSVFGQNTVGLLSYQPWKSYDGYNMIFPHNQPNVYLINNCGEIVHTWEDEDSFRPGNTAYLLDDGRLVKTKRPAAIAGNPIWAGGGGATVEIRDWDNNLEWSFTKNDSLERLHHDIAVMPNGNILMISWELITEAEALQAGRDPSTMAEGELWPDYVLEVDPTTDEVVWEWHAFDHLIQDFDATKDNFGVVADHPEKINLNWDTNSGKADWLHANAIDYIFDAELGLDHVVLSIPYFNEVWVIDHSTTTEEAATGSGGDAGKGGDLIYRWGNQQAYNQGDSTNQKLFFQHDVHWVDEYIDNSHPLFGKMAAFNNGAGDDFSSVVFWTPPWDMYTFSYLQDDDVFNPVNFDLNITHPTPTSLYSTGLSSVQALPNGNFLICSGRFGYSFELTPTNEVVWEYKTPLLAGNPVNQGDSLSINNNLTFRMVRIPLDNPAFEGRDLTPGDYLELNPNTTFCETILPVTDIDNEYELKIFPNPTNSEITIEWSFPGMVDIEIFDYLGQQVDAFKGMGGRKYCRLENYGSGVYYLRINKEETRKFVVID